MTYTADGFRAELLKQVVMLACRVVGVVWIVGVPRIAGPSLTQTQESIYSDHPCTLPPDHRALTGQAFPGALSTW